MSVVRIVSVLTQLVRKFASWQNVTCTFRSRPVCMTLFRLVDIVEGAMD